MELNYYTVDLKDYDSGIVVSLRHVPSTDEMSVQSMALDLMKDRSYRVIAVDREKD